MVQENLKKKFLEEDKVSLDNVQKFEGYKKICKI